MFHIPFYSINLCGSTRICTFFEKQGRPNVVKMFSVFWAILVFSAKLVCNIACESLRLYENLPCYHAV